MLISCDSFDQVLKMEFERFRSSKLTFYFCYIRVFKSKVRPKVTDILNSVLATASVKYRIRWFSLGGALNYIWEFNQPKNLSSSNQPIYYLNMAFYF